MLERPRQLLTKAELLDGVWGDQFVTESALTTRVKQIRQALGDDGRAQRVIQTVHGRGYRFVAEVTVEADAEDEPVGLTEEEGSPREQASALEVAKQHNIPPSRTEVVGRAALVASGVEAIEQARLVSMIGLGGVGKTTLAQEVGRRAAQELEHGAWFVDLVPVRDADGIDLAVANAIGATIGSDGGRAELLERVAGRDLLLIIDNCEHIVDDVAQFCSDVLDSTSGPRLLATSRIPLRISGERRLPVPPLSVSDADGSAVDLLDAVGRRYGVAIPPENRIAAISLCLRLDGLPLAIELMGAKLPTMSVPEILDRVDRLIAADSRERRPDRHASLETILSDTFANLGAEERRLLSTLALVQGPFTVDDVESIGDQLDLGDAMASFEALLEQSLLVVMSETPRRYTLLEMIRQHAKATDPAPSDTAIVHAEWLLNHIGRTLDRHYHDIYDAQWVTHHLSDLLSAEQRLREDERINDAGWLLASTGLAMHLDDGARAARVLDRMQPYFESVDDPALSSRLHCSGVMAAMASRRSSAMYQHGLQAVAQADKTDDEALQAFARVMRSWAGVVIDVDAAIEDLDTAIDLARRAGDAGTEMMAAGYKIYHLAMALRFDEAVELGFSVFDPSFSGAHYPFRVVSLGLICCLVVEDPGKALEIDSQGRTEFPMRTMWGSEIMRASIHAGLDRPGETLEAVESIEAHLEHSGISPLPDILLVPAVLANARGDAGRASRYLGALRGADKPTQSLMVSTAYRALRCHVEPDTDGVAATEAIWDEAVNWMQELT